MITLHNPGIVKKTFAMRGPGGLAQFSTWKATGAGLGGFYLSRVVTKLVDTQVISRINAVQGRTISRVVLTVLGMLGVRAAGIALEGVTRDGSGNALTLGGMLGVLQGTVMPAILPEQIKGYLAAPGDWGGDLDVIPKQPLAGGAYGTEWDNLGQPYYENLNGMDDLQSEYANAQLDAGEDETYYSF